MQPSSDEKRTILIIEDDLALLQLTQHGLELDGFHVITALDGAAGIHTAKEHLPDLIVCDLKMPGVGGYDVLRSLRAYEPTSMIPIIFLTGDLNPRTQREGMELGADDFLTKPIDLPKLLAAINSQLQKYEHLKAAQLAEQRNLEQARQRLSLMIAHELRTPLMAIDMVQEMLSMGWEGLSRDEVELLLVSLRKGTRRLNHLIEQMVLLTQVETGVLNYSLITQFGMGIRLGELLNNAIELARRFDTRRQDAEIIIKEQTADLTVRCDPSSLQHALAEIISNAMTFSPPNGTVLISQWLRDNEYWITISDRGRGMTQQEKVLAMQDFQQIDRESREQQGIGMGLPLSKRIVEVHKGRLEINSVPDKGTQVVIVLPAIASEVFPRGT
jgi:signal transduction histidine kinase